MARPTATPSTSAMRPRWSGRMIEPSRFLRAWSLYTSTSADWFFSAPMNWLISPVEQCLLEQDEEHEQPDGARPSSPKRTLARRISRRARNTRRRLTSAAPSRAPTRARYAGRRSGSSSLGRRAVQDDAVGAELELASTPAAHCSAEPEPAGASHSSGMSVATCSSSAVVALPSSAPRKPATNGSARNRASTAGSQPLVRTIRSP